MCFSKISSSGEVTPHFLSLLNQHDQYFNNLHMLHVNVIFLIFKKLSEKSLRAEEFCYKNTEMVAILTISVLNNPDGAVPSRHPCSYGTNSNVGLAAT